MVQHGTRSERLQEEETSWVVTCKAVLHVQVQNALHMGWVDYCAALVTAKRMQEDIDGRTLIIHNGDVSYAECVWIPAIMQRFVHRFCLHHSMDILMSRGRSIG